MSAACAAGASRERVPARRPRPSTGSESLRPPLRRLPPLTCHPPRLVSSHHAFQQLRSRLRRLHGPQLPLSRPLLQLPRAPWTLPRPWLAPASAFSRSASSARRSDSALRASSSALRFRGLPVRLALRLLCLLVELRELLRLRRCGLRPRGSLSLDVGALLRTSTATALPRPRSVRSVCSPTFAST